MKSIRLIWIGLSLLSTINLFSQSVKLNTNLLEPINVSVTVNKVNGKEEVKVIKSDSIKEFDEPTFAKIKGIDFRNGSIEVKVFSRLLSNAPASARGFIGVAFRIDDRNSKFECIYIRPTNGRDTSQIRRNHSIQYFSFPDYKFERLRKEVPGEYESYADIGLNEWIQLKIVVKNNQAKLFINNARQPSLIVNDLKHGADASGTIGLWVDIGTEGIFSDLKVYQ